MLIPPPPPYANIGGISRADMKDNRQESFANYDGNARPGELVVDLTTYDLYVGNAAGYLNIVGGGSGNGVPGGGNTQIQFNNAGNFGGSANLTWGGANLNVGGNVLPQANVTYSLGSSTLQWKDLWVSNNTIYINSIPLSISSSNTLQVNGANVVTTSANNQTNVTSISATGNVAGGNITTTGYVSAAGNVTGSYILGNGAFLTGISGGSTYGNSNVASYLPTYTGALAGATAYVGGNNPGEYFLDVAADHVSLGMFAGQSVAVSAGGIQIAGTAGVTIMGVVGAPVVLGGGSSGEIQIANNVSASGSITAASFIGDGSQLTNLPAGNYGNSNVEAFLPTYDGELPNLTGNVTTAANVTANYFIGDGSQLTNLSYGNANVEAFLPTYDGELPNLTGNVTTAANVTANYFIGDGSQLTNLPLGNYSNANVTAYLASGTDTGGYTTAGDVVANTVVGSSVNSLGDSSIVGNVTANSFIGDGSQLTNLPAGDYSNANVTAYLPTNTADVGAGNVSASGNVSGNYALFNEVVINDLSANAILYSDASRAVFNTDFSYDVSTNTMSGGNISVTGNVSASYLLGNGSQLTGLPAGYSNSNAAAYFASGNATTDIITTANVTANYFIGDGSQITNLPLGDYSNSNVASYLSSGINTSITTTANIQADYFFGNGSQLTGLPAAYGDSNVSLYLASGTDTAGINTSGNLTTTNILATSGIVAYGEIHSAGALITDTNLFVTGAANISTSLNVFGPAAVAGSITGDAGLILAGTANIGSSLNVGGFTQVVDMAASGNISASAVGVGASGVNMTGNLIYTTTPNIIIDPGNDGLTGGNLYVQGNLQVTGNVTYLNVTTAVTDNLVWQAANAASSPSAASGGGITVGPAGSPYATWTYNPTGNAWVSNIAIISNGGANINGPLSGATTGTFTGTVTASGFVGNGSALTSVTGANVTGTVANATYATSASTASTVTTAAQPNITSVGTLSSLSVSGNTTSSYFIGNGSELASITGANVTGTVANATYATSAGSATIAETVTTAAQPNITSVGILTSLSSTGNVGTTGNLAINGSGELYIATNNGHGGANYAGIMTMTNTNAGTTNSNKFIRLNPTGALEVINSAYTGTILALDDSGNLSVPGQVSGTHFTASSTSGGSYSYRTSTLTTTNNQIFGMDNINFRFSGSGSTGSLQISPNTSGSSWGAMAEMIYLASGTAISQASFGPQIITSPTWYTLMTNLNTVGNQTTGVVMDYSNELAYRVTCIVRTLSPNWNAFIIIERLT